MWISDNTGFDRGFPIQSNFGDTASKSELMEMFEYALEQLVIAANIAKVNAQTDEEQEADMGYYIKQNKRNENSSFRHSN